MLGSDQNPGPGHENLALTLFETERINCRRLTFHISRKIDVINVDLKTDNCDDDTKLDDDTGGTEVSTSLAQAGSSGFTQVESHIVNSVT